MKRTLKQSQLENMISECVGQVLAESRQPRRQSMNEAQLSRYIQNIINEEMESEGWRGKITGALSGAYKGLKGEVNKAKRGIMDTGLNTEYQGQNLGSRWKTLKNNINTSAQAGDNTEELRNLQKQVNQMINSGLLSNNAVQYAKAFLESMSKSIGVQTRNVNSTFQNGYGQ